MEDRPDLRIGAERIDHLELLWMVCERKGWALLLRAEGPGGELRLAALDVVDPAAGRSMFRHKRLVAGDLIARARLEPCVTVEAAACAIIVGLEREGYLRSEAA